MADEKPSTPADDTPVDATPAAPVDKEVVAAESMDEIIDKQAEADALAEKTGEPDKEEEKPESEAPEDKEVKEDEEAPAPTGAAEEEVVEEEKEDEEDKEPEVEIDKTSFTQVGLEAVPEDYKPNSWKGFLQDAVDVIRGEVNKEQIAQSEQSKAFKSEVDKVNTDWQNEIEQLQKAGDIPKGKEEAEVETKKVFEYMAANNKQYESQPNKQIWSFETAFKLMQSGKVTEERSKEIIERRKARANATAGSSSSEGGSGIPRPRKGESMDDIMARELDQM